MYQDLDGIEIEIKQNRGLVLDTRKSRAKPKCVGLIMPALKGRGYTFCPFVRRSFVFNRSIPKANFRAPERAGAWLKRHSVVYKKRRYTPFNPLMRIFHELPGSRFSELRTQVVLLMVLFAVFLMCYPAEGFMMLILTKGLAGVAVVGAAINTYLLLRG